MSSSRPVVPRRARPVIAQPSYITPNYHSRVWGRLIFVLFLLALAVAIGGGGAIYWMFHRAQGSSSTPVQVHVVAGDTVTSVANRLHSMGLVGNPLFFRLDAKLQGLSSNLKAGDYTVRPNMDIDQMVGAFKKYHEVTIAVTIPEGMRMEQIAAILQRKGIDPASFLAEARHPDLHYLNATILNDKPVGATLEGYLFPNTYFVRPHSSGKAFARLMVETLDRNFTPTMRATAHAHKFSIFQTLTLASIVEREAVHESERPEIAGVYANRLRLGGWVLNADPTIQYAVGTRQNWWPVLTQAQLQVQSPYNTYLHQGLPPGPIANPGLASIKAAANPKPTKFMYFVAKGNTGYHVFAQTLAEQTAHIHKYQH